MEKGQERAMVVDHGDEEDIGLDDGVSGES